AGEIVAECDGQPRDIAPWPGKTRHDSGAKRISRDKDNWDRPGKVFRGENGRRTDGHQDVHLESDELGNQITETYISSLRPSCFNREVLPLNVAVLAHAETKGVKEVTIGGSRLCAEETYPPCLPSLLRFGGTRRGEEGKSPCDERSPLHYWISSSARASTEGGIVTPSAFAVFRLMTSSNLVGSSIGRSVGLAPLRILSMKMARRL